MNFAAYEADIGGRLHEAVSIPFKVVTIGDRKPLVARCHDNVDAWVAAHPGSVPVRGWVTCGRFGESFMFCAHSVVQGHDGQLLDITPLEKEDDRAGMRFVRHNGSAEDFDQAQKRNVSFLWPPINYGLHP